MARPKKYNDYGTGIPREALEPFALTRMPDIFAYLQSEEGQKEFAEWQARRDVEEPRSRKNPNSA